MIWVQVQVCWPEEQSCCVADARWAILGLRDILRVSMPDAFHDSAARKNPPRCHLGTRQDYIKKITSWGAGTLDDHHERILWMHGPAGVGKSAVAQSCAELFAEKQTLAASIFLSRPNQRNNPNYILPSIAYQIATKLNSFAAVLDEIIRKDPTVLTRTLNQQFYRLLVEPFQRPQIAEMLHAEEHVVIIDGVDECEDLDAQPELIEIIAASARDRSTPFRWILLSRPERHIVNRMRTAHISSLVFHVELPVSREIDHEVLLYLSDELSRIGEERGFPPTWLSEGATAILVELAAGLFIYAATVVRFIGERNSTGPVDRLNAVLALQKRQTRRWIRHPLAALDLFYTLIVQYIPSEIRPTILKILLLHSGFINLGDQRRVPFAQMPTYANILGLSEPQFRDACAPLQSVLDIVSQSPEMLVFYHASFMEFMQDLERSGEFGVHSVMQDLRIEMLDRLNLVHSQSQGILRILYLLYLLVKLMYFI
ncbi:hypothetical protein AN958_01949 [Leucoagaricus sp. SymC.cos]|nr:hypothetical protein AN958_01949 [Leucoagaricus sp. SymC.cos]